MLDKMIGGGSRPARLLVALACALGSVSGCDSLNNLRAFLRGEDLSGAALKVEVVPKDNIRILLDGKQVATASPYLGKNLAPGNHVLEVKASGHHPFKLPITLTEGKTLTVPVALRGGAAVILGPEPEPEPPPTNPEPPAPPLPYGVDPVVLTLAATPEMPFTVDGAPVKGKQAKLERVYGTVAAGTLTLNYRLGGAGLLEFTVPDGPATWTRDGGAILLPGNSFRLHQGATRVTRVAPDGTGQTLLIKR